MATMRSDLHAGNRQDRSGRPQHLRFQGVPAPRVEVTSILASSELRPGCESFEPEEFKAQIVDRGLTWGHASLLTRTVDGTQRQKLIDRTVAEAGVRARSSITGETPKNLADRTKPRQAADHPTHLSDCAGFKDITTPSLPCSSARSLT